MRIWLWVLIVLTGVTVAGCKARKSGSGPNLRGMDVDKAIAKNKEQQLKFKILTLKGKADMSDPVSGKSFGLNYRIDIAKDSLILINLSKLGIPAMNMLISKDTVKMRIALNQTAAICDFSLLKKTTKLDMDFTKLQALLLGEAVLEQPIALLSAKGNAIELQGSRPPYQVYWILNGSHFRLEKMRMEDTNLGTESELTYFDFKKVDGQTVATSMILQATQGQSVRIELHHSGIEFDKEKVNFKYRIPESYKILPCDSLQKQ